MFKKSAMHFICINANSLFPKMMQCAIANITNAPVIGISQTKLDENILLNELDINGCHLVRLDRVRFHIVTKADFAVTSKVFLLRLICVNLGQSYWASYIDHPVNQSSLGTLIMFLQKLGFQINNSVISQETQI